MAGAGDIMTSPTDENPFQGMKIKDWSILENIEGRAVCPNCKKSRKYFCYSCYVPVPGLEEHVPKVKLPIKIDIIKHASEIDGKSTAAHAAVIAPEDVTIYTYPCIPDYSAENNVVLIFPGKNAVSIEEYLSQNAMKDDCDSSRDDICSEPRAKRANISKSGLISKAVFIDSTWNQSRGIYKDQRLREIPCVVIQSRISQFWRHQHGSPRWFLATIEAVHQFLVEFHIICELGVRKESAGCPRQDNTNELEAEMLSNEQQEIKLSSVSLTKPIDKELSLTASQSVSPIQPSVSKSPFTASESESPITSSQHKLQVAITSSQTEAESTSKSSPKKVPHPDKLPSKFVKNLALCRGIRTDSGGDPGINLCGPDQWKGKYDGDYDNLLFFFQFMYYKIHSLYSHDNLRSYQRQMT